MISPRSKWTLLVVLVVVLVALDQWTKFLAVERLTTVFERAEDVSFADKVRGFYTYRHLEPLATDPHYVYRPLWRMNYVENPGAAWGLFRRFPPGFRHAFFTAVSLGAAFFILRYYRRVREDQRFLQLALVFVLAGAMGNFLDRLARRYVIDFIEWYWWNSPNIRWPTFNIADSLIVVGVAMLLLHPGPPKEEDDAVARRRKEQAGAA
jgi:signal peptidase II